MIRFDRLAMTASAASIALLCAAGVAQAQDFAITQDEIKAGKKEYSPYLHQAYPNRVFWGDTHLHTSYSTDSGGLAGRTALTS